MKKVRTARVLQQRSDFAGRGKPNPLAAVYAEAAVWTPMVDAGAAHDAVMLSYAMHGGNANALVEGGERQWKGLCGSRRRKLSSQRTVCGDAGGIRL